MSENVAAIEGKLETKAGSQRKRKRRRERVLHGSVKGVLTSEGAGPFPPGLPPVRTGPHEVSFRGVVKLQSFLNRSQTSLQGPDMSHVLLSDMQVSSLHLSLNIFIVLLSVERQS